MNPMFIKILRWMMQAKVWRFIGFASAIIGLLCYALSSSFNHLFGHWNLFKIILYTVFSFIICFLVLYAKTWNQSSSVRFEAHFAFLILTITSVYSFFYDKVVNGKPDAYSLISYVAFAIMSLSLSRQTQCKFQIDLLYFFLGCLILQLMKIKLQLGIVGAAFSYSLIILRSCFPSIDAGLGNDCPPGRLEDGNSVALVVDSPEIYVSSLMEQLRTPPPSPTSHHHLLPATATTTSDRPQPPPPPPDGHHHRRPTTIATTLGRPSPPPPSPTGQDHLRQATTATTTSGRLLPPGVGHRRGRSAFFPNQRIRNAKTIE